MPGLAHGVAGPLAGHGQAVELARQADREVADVDHLLHLAEALLQDLAGLQRDQTAERRLVSAQFLAEQADQLAAAGGGGVAPGGEGGGRPADRGGDIGRRVLRQPGGLGAIDRRAGHQRVVRPRAGGEGTGGNAQALHQGCDFGHDVHAPDWRLTRSGHAPAPRTAQDRGARQERPSCEPPFSPC